MGWATPEVWTVEMQQSSLKFTKLNPSYDPGILERLICNAHCNLNKRYTKKMTK